MSQASPDNELGEAPALAPEPTRGLAYEYSEDCPVFFASARRTLLARPEHVSERLSLLGTERLPFVLEDKLRALAAEGAAQPMVAGALPFDGSATRAPFWLLHDVRSVDGRSTQGLVPRARGLLATARGYSVRLSPSAQDYVAAVAQAAHHIQRGELDKVVLARGLTLNLEQPISASELLRQLVLQNRTGFAFALEVGASPANPRKLLGVSPELLLEKRQNRVFTNPLAGSRPRGRDRSEDELLARALLDSAKDRHEHALVIDAVASALRPWCRDLQVPRGPSLISTPTMWHLSTVITGELRDPRCSSLALAQALHPTPAVCGQPREPAAALIRKLENFDRGLFAGAVGYCDAHGDGEWAVTLRCAELTPRELCTFAGAGIVAESDPWSEFDETASKLGTILRALGLVQPEVQA
jgi:isochorismate synthase